MYIDKKTRYICSNTFHTRRLNQRDREIERERERKRERERVREREGEGGKMERYVERVSYIANRDPFIPNQNLMADVELREIQYDTLLIFEGDR